MAELTVETRDVEGVTLLYPTGFINAHTVRVFEGEIQKALAQGRFKIVVNCGGLAYIASAGLGAIMGAIEEIRGNGGDLRLANLNETVRNIFEILGFNHLYRIYASEVEAITSFRGAEEAGS
ncbi:MAG TPA: STAS domain-containing protein [Vicinamibacteria bacterium]|jgi:anti-sigma B factor antagonist|nr:STAS domain-containing protein [Vicinamibacteria bacterium]